MKNKRKLTFTISLFLFSTVNIAKADHDLYFGITNCGPDQITLVSAGNDHGDDFGTKTISAGTHNRWTFDAQGDTLSSFIQGMNINGNDEYHIEYAMNHGHGKNMDVIKTTQSDDGSTQLLVRTGSENVLNAYYIHVNRRGTDSYYGDVAVFLPPQGYDYKNFPFDLEGCAYFLGQKAYKYNIKNKTHYSVTVKEGNNPLGTISSNSNYTLNESYFSGNKQIDLYIKGNLYQSLTLNSVSGVSSLISPPSTDYIKVSSSGTSDLNGNEMTITINPTSAPLTACSVGNISSKASIVFNQLDPSSNADIGDRIKVVVTPENSNVISCELDYNMSSKAWQANGNCSPDINTKLENSNTFYLLCTGVNCSYDTYCNTASFA
ncbi:hypothetical protein [Facilibium subflavum]|uniref:hypothetical protein n=1 Tax=Facilibium subflavum TaxID=2219058 RepID=UPI000E650134|nr:hypothetical protein [Facilibium subflavum]